MNKLKRFQPELVIQAFPETYRGNPAKINKGQCFRWAFIAYNLFEDVELWSYGIHAFVKVEKKFYDSERLQGEEDWKDLPACNFGKGCGNLYCISCKKARSVSLDTFQEKWGPFYHRPWHLYQQAAEDLLQRKNNELATQ
jgi:hypothetical protein